MSDIGAIAQNSNDPEFAAVVNRDFQEDREEQRRYTKNHERYRHYKEGDQWMYKMRPAWKALPVMNYSAGIIRTIIPEITAQQPSINIASIRPGREEIADILQDATRKVMSNNRMTVKDPITLEDMLTYGVGLTRVWYDSRADDIAITPLDPRFFFPAAGTIELQRARRVNIVWNQPLADFAREFGIDPKLIRPGAWDDAFTHRPVEPQRTYGREDSHNSTDGILVPEGNYGASGSSGEVPMVTRLERWEAVEIPEEEWGLTADGTIDEQRREDDEKRPWKIVCSVLGNGYVARKRRRPFHHKLYPFAVYPCYPINSQFWPTGLMSMLEGPQDQLNRMVAYECDLIRMASNPAMAVHEEAGISVKDITNRIAGYIRWKGAQPPTWMTPPPFRGEVFQSQENAKRHAEFVSGVHPSFRGEHSKGVNSGVQEETLSNRTGGRIKQLATNFESGKRDEGILVVALIKQFYQNRTIRVGPGKYVTINGLLKDGSPDPKTDVTTDDYEVEIGVGSTLPVDKGLRYTQYKELFERGAIAKKSLLRKMGESEEEINKLERELAEESEEALAMQSGGSPGGSAPPAGAAPGADAAQADAGAPRPSSEVPTDQEIQELMAQVGS